MAIRAPDGANNEEVVEMILVLLEVMYLKPGRMTRMNQCGDVFPLFAISPPEE